MNIDWSKAPEGATHFAPDGCGVSARWFDMSVGELGAVWYESKWHTIKYTANRQDLIARPTPITAEWNGEGLPPVGTVCEINHPTKNWVRCEIVAHKHFDCGSKPHAIAWIDRDTLDQSQGIRFRPARTPEQIAEQERQAAVSEMFNEAQVDFSAGDLMSAQEYVIRALAALYDKGYRKEAKP